MTELDEVAALVVSWARASEEVEAYVSRSRTTNVRTYNGEIESLSSAEPAGAGIRVVVDGRQGFAWAGTLDEGVLKDTLEEARDNASFGEPDEYAGVARPDGVAPPDLDLVRPELLATPTAAKVELALDL
ncbi:MAG TPA: DNA gyrase modulator, partial [Acidimicrobiia bacterium]|nr:DNA gyrase modulator [Acidimicrobiia bacterium]